MADSTPNRGVGGVSRRMVLALSGSAVALAGCSNPLSEENPPVEAVELSIQDVRSPDLGVTSATIPLVFAVANTDSERDLPSSTIEYTVSLSDTEVAETREDIPELGPGDSTSLAFDVTASYSDLGTSVVDALDAGQFRVRIAGTIESAGERATFADSFQYP